MVEEQGCRERGKAGMKVQCELDIKVAMGGANHNGTGLQAYLPDGTRYRDIVKAFGKPQSGLSPDSKIKVEWIGRVNGIVFTIYDYKSKLDPEKNTDWHIGGKVKLAAELVNLYFGKIKEQLEKSKHG